mgnify:CR=1 FL=1
MAGCAVFLAFLGTHAAAPVDWLVDPSPFKARAEATNDGRQIVLQNGLVRRVVQLGSNAATVEFSSVTTGESWLRAVKPEAVVEIDGQRLEVGGLKGQPNRAFLRPEWPRTMTSSPTAFRYVGHVVGKTAERMPWKRVRHHAPDVAWPPPGVSLRLDFASPAGMALAFCLRNPGVTSVVVGASSGAQLRENITGAAQSFADDVWRQVEQLFPV